MRLEDSARFCRSFSPGLAIAAVRRKLTLSSTRERDVVRRRSTRLRWWPDGHQWISAIAAVGTLLLAIVSFWTTTRVSGLEGYLKSEIARRNADLSTASARMVALERETDQRRIDVEKLNAAAAGLTLAALTENDRLRDYQSKTADLEAQHGHAEERLSATMATLSKVNEEREHQSIELDIIARRHAVEVMSRAASPFELDFDDTHALDSRPNQLINVGRASLARVQNLHLSLEEGNLRPLIDAANARLLDICPDFADETIKVPAISPAPVRRPAPEAGETQAHLNERAQTAESTWDIWLKTASDASSAKMSAEIAAGTKFQDCICRALSTSTAPRSRVCSVQIDERMQ